MEHRSFPDLDPAFRAQVLRRAPGAEGWLEGLPQLWSRLSRRWGLVVAGAAGTGATSVVLPVEECRSGRRAALKLVSPVASAGDEAAALIAFDGRGAVALRDVDVDAQALLLEWLEGPSLQDEPDRSRAMRIAGGIAAELATAVAPPAAPSLAVQAIEWLRQLRHQHDFARRTGTALPDARFGLAAEIVSRLAEDRAAGLTHGDLSLSNIRRGERGWVAVDPSLVAGTAAYEAHTVVRSHLAEIVASDDPVALATRWTREFTAAAGVDHREAWELSYARFVASYYWEGQNQGDPITIERLRRGATVFIPVG